MLAAAQFIMVLDTTVMNVSISQIVGDLNTSVVGLQTAITIYTLVMAAFMLIGSKLGDKWGPRSAYAIGLLVYGAGSLTTALSPNLSVLLVGWSFIEGFGAVLVIPAIAALTAVTYSGRQRALAYGILGGVSGASAALGPIIGGWVTANFTWRLVFASETIVVLLLMLFLRAIPSTPGRSIRLDLPGAFFSAAGLGLAVFGILRSSQWGWIIPKAGAPFTLLDLSPVFLLIIAGASLLWCFFRHEAKVIAAKVEPLLDIRLLAIPALRAGLTTLLAQQLIQMGTFFILPLYLQTVLGYNALQTGITILPLSLSLFFFALGGSTLTGRISPQRIVQFGLVGMLLGEILLIFYTASDLHTVGFGLALGLIGAGLGLMSSQISNVNMSAVPIERGSEVGGLQGTVYNLGASLGTALIGSILIASLMASFQHAVQTTHVLAPISDEIIAAGEADPNFITVDQIRALAEKAGLTEEQVNAVAKDYADAQITSLKAAFAGIAVFALLALAYVHRLPKKAGDSEDAGQTKAKPKPKKHRRK